MSREEPETPLTRAALVMMLGAAMLGLRHEDLIGPGGVASQAFLAGGCLLIAGGVVGTLRALYRQWKDRSR